MNDLEAFVLLTAVKAQRKDAVAKLVRSSYLKDEINTPSQKGHLSVVAHTLAVQQMKGLLNEQVLENDKSKRDQMSFHSWAAQCGHSSLIDILLNEDLLNTSDDQLSIDRYKSDHSNGLTLLGLAAFCGHGSVCRVLLASGIDFEATDTNGRVALHHACSQGHSQVAKLLLGSGAKVGAGAGRSMQTSLHMAAKNGYGPVCRILLANGADPEARDQDGQTALHCASLRGLDEVVHILLRGGAEVGAVDSCFKQTSLHMAARNGHKSVCQNLLANEADPEARDQRGETALHYASFKGFDEVVDLLLRSGADIGARNGLLGSTALHNAAFAGHHNVVRMLIERGADIDIPDEFKRTALIKALAERHDAVSSVLLDSGANPFLKSDLGQDAASWVLSADPESGAAEFSGRILSMILSSAYKFRGDGALPTLSATPFRRAEITLINYGFKFTHLWLKSHHAYIELPSDASPWINMEHRKILRIFEPRFEPSFKFWVVHQEETLSFAILDRGFYSTHLRVLNGGVRINSDHTYAIQQWENIELDPNAEIVEPDAVIPLPWWSSDLSPS